MTNGPETPKETVVGSEAESLFYSLLEEGTAGEPPGLEALCGARPDLADELRSLCERHRRAREVLGVVAVPGADEPEPDDPPARPGRYEIRGEIARGGIGSILEVWDAELQRTLAMKVARRDQLEENVLGRVHYERRQSRLLNEAQILGQLDHPGIVPVHEVGRNERGELYFAMQRVRGRDLSEIIDCVAREEEGWTLPRAVGVVLRVCEAMAHAHSKGVIHRDLKPGNVMVGRFGETYVIDWGLAKAVGSPEAANIRLREVAVSAPPDGEGSSEGEAPSVVRTHRQADSDSDPASPLWTMEGDVIGTPAYMSPEQARGRIEEVDERSDVYGAGALLYHLLSGKRPYSTSGSRRSPQEVLGMVLHGPPDPLRSAAPGAPDELVAIGEKAMARDPERRYAGMEEMAEDLRAWLEGRVVRAHATGAWAQLRKWVGRNKGMAAAILVTALGLAAVTGIQTRSAMHAGRQATDLRRSDYFNRVALAQAAFEKEDIARMKELLEACPAELRSWEWHYLNRCSDTSDATLRGHERPVYGVALSQDGRWIASAGADGKAILWGMKSLEPIHVLTPQLNVHGVVFSPDGATLLAGGGPNASLLDVETGRMLHVLQPHRYMIDRVAFSLDGRACCTAGRDGVIREWDVASGHLIQTHDISEELGALDSPSEDGWLERMRLQQFSEIWPSPDASLSAQRASDRRGYFVRDVATDEIVHELPGFPQESGREAFWMPDGNRLVTSSGPIVHVWDTSTWQERATLVGHEDRILQVASFGEGRWLATASWDRTVRLWDLHRPGRENRNEVGKSLVRSLAFHPSGELVACALDEGKVVIGDIVQRRTLRTFPIGGHRTTVAFSPDGRRLATGRDDGKLRLWDAETGELLRTLEGHHGLINHLAFHPDGIWIATAGADHTLRLWDGATGEGRWAVEANLGQHRWPYGVLHLAISPDGESIATCAWEGCIRLWRTRDGEQEQSLSGEATRYGACLFSPDGRRLIGRGSEPMLMQMWELDSGKTLWVEETGILRGAAFANNGSRLIAWSDVSLGVLDAESGRLILGTEGQGVSGKAAALSPDGSRVVTGDRDGTLRVWDSSPWQPSTRP